jgi:hypothetical protein
MHGGAFSFSGGRRPPATLKETGPMAKTNYSFEKRQREIAKKKKKDAKRQRKLDNAANPDDDTPDKQT